MTKDNGNSLDPAHPKQQVEKSKEENPCALYFVNTLLDITAAINSAKGTKFDYIVCLYINRGFGAVRVKIENASSDMNLHNFFRHLILKGRYINVYGSEYEVMENHTKFAKIIRKNPELKYWTIDDGYDIEFVKSHAYLMVKERKSELENYESTYGGYYRYLYRKELAEGIID